MISSNNHPQAMTERELDALVAEKIKALNWYNIRETKTIYGDQNFVALTYEDDMRGSYEIPRYSKDISAAFQVMEKMMETCFFVSLGYGHGAGWVCTIYPDSYSSIESKGCPIAARAVCEAALKALGVEVPA